MNGIIMMAAFMAVAAAIWGLIFIVTRLLPVNHPLRKFFEGASDWVKKNPNQFEKRFKQISLFLIIAFFTALTLIYS
jgi:hypothetical protein